MKTFLRFMPVVVIAVLALGAGCSASVSTSLRPSPSGMDLSKGWPATAHRPVAEPFGLAQNIRKPGVTETPNIDAYLKPEALAKTEIETKPEAKPRMDLVAATQAEPSIEVITAPIEVAAVTAPPTTPSDVDRYATRDRSDKQQQDFRGGDRAIVITSGAVVLTLLILLIVLLVT